MKVLLKSPFIIKENRLHKRMIQTTGDFSWNLHSNFHVNRNKEQLHWFQWWWDFNLLVVVRRNVPIPVCSLFPAILSKWNALILRNGQSSENHAAEKPFMLFCDWKWKGKNAWWPNRSFLLLIFVISCQSISVTPD